MGRLLDEDIVIGAISKILSERCGGNTVWWKPVAEAVVKNLPSAQPSNGACWGCQCEKVEKLQPEREKGYIVIRVISMVDGEDCFCSECGAYCLSTAYKFCPKCGIKFIGVRGEQDEIDNCYQIN